jgi:hypothetical protein
MGIELGGRDERDRARAPAGMPSPARTAVNMRAKVRLSIALLLRKRSAM